ncbi:MAG: septal ring lytic transglycosylase RlpA family protein [Azonexus sp.]|jgi:rare lipoprotein A|nr:septal ring lytic transglycosylase RlpA family protein [Azonexus sp.]
MSLRSPGSCLAISLILLLGACSSKPARSPQGPEMVEPAAPIASSPRAGKRGGGYYKDDGPADEIPDNLDQIPDAVPRWEPLHKPALRPYEVFGKRYTPNTRLQAHKERGIASWYGKKFHGQKTSIGIPYDMFAMTAAHPTLALPSYVRVTNVQNGRSVVVRVIDRGPFHAGRVIDLSYTAAYKLGIINGGSGQVEVEAILPGNSTSSTYSDITPPVTQAQNADDKRIEARLPKGIYLQLGAFANADNADNLKLHLERELDWIQERMHIQNAGDGLHRLQLGPYANRAAAEAIAEQIRNTLGYRPAIVNR